MNVSLQYCICLSQRSRRSSETCVETDRADLLVKPMSLKRRLLKYTIPSNGAQWIAETRLITQRIFHEPSEMSTDPEAKMLAAAFERLVSIRKRISAKQAHQKKQSNAITSVNSKGKGNPNKLTHPCRPYQIPHDPPPTQPSLASPPKLPQPSPFPSSAAETQNPTPSISPTIDALDLATHSNPQQYIRTHKGKQGKRNKKKNKHPGSNVYKKMKEANQPITRAEKDPVCKYGSRRVLDGPGDDREGRVCWFHRWEVGRRRGYCQRLFV